MVAFRAKSVVLKLADTRDSLPLSTLLNPAKAKNTGAEMPYLPPNREILILREKTENKRRKMRSRN